MNILDVIDKILGLPNTFIGTLPEKPDSLAALFEYPGTPPEHFFGETDYSHNVQVRIRAKSQDAARQTAEGVQDKLSGYDEDRFSIRQISNIIPLGQDGANPPRYEFTVNFIVLMK